MGPNYKLVRKRVHELGLSTTHWTRAVEAPRHRSLEEVMVRGSDYPTGALKRRILKAGLLEVTCALCGLGPKWQGEPLTLRIDHINGVRNDHRLENLRLLCPNCDSQTDTFCGRNRPRGPKQLNHCPCGAVITPQGRHCRSCAARACQPSKITWPSRGELEKRIEASSVLGVARELGVSDNAVRKHMRRWISG